MQLVSTDQLVQNLIKISPLGYEVSIRHGLLRSTKCIYQKDDIIFLFDMFEEFILDKENGVPKQQFVLEYIDWIWDIEQTIS
jgi:hypothetical protein